MLGNFTKFVKEASLTLQVFAFVLILSIPGIVVAFLLQLRSKDPWTKFYIWIRPLYQLIFIYYVLPSIGIRIAVCLITAFTLNYDILRKSSVEEQLRSV